MSPDIPKTDLTKTPKADAAKKKSEESLAAANEILKEYGGLLSNIPHNSSYWDHINAHQAANEEWKRLSGLNL